MSLRQVAYQEVLGKGGGDGEFSSAVKFEKVESSSVTLSVHFRYTDKGYTTLLFAFELYR